MEEDILNYLYQLSCFVGHPVPVCEMNKSFLGKESVQLPVPRGTKKQTYSISL